MKSRYQEDIVIRSLMFILAVGGWIICDLAILVIIAYTKKDLWDITCWISISVPTTIVVCIALRQHFFPVAIDQTS